MTVLQAHDSVTSIVNRYSVLPVNYTDKCILFNLAVFISFDHSKVCLTTVAGTYTLLLAVLTHISINVISTTIGKKHTVMGS